MDIQAEKLILIEYIAQVKDSAIVEKLRQFVKANESDFWNNLDEKLKQEIKQGIVELQRGEKFDYDEVMAKYR